MTSQVAAEAAGYQTSNKQGNTRGREAGPCPAPPCSLSPSSLYLSSPEWKIEEAISFPASVTGGGILLVVGEEEEEEDMDL